MRVGVFGTGVVGQAIASRLVQLNHEVMMGARDPANRVAAEWASHHAPGGRAGSFADAAEFGSFMFLCVSGGAAAKVVGEARLPLRGKLLIDVTNPLDFSGGEPGLFVGLTDSLGEQIQRAAPHSYVVKALNTVTAEVMVRPGSVPGDHVAFVAGNDENAKADTRAVLAQFGWPDERLIDAGALSGARATEAYLPLWLKLMRHLGHANFNIEVRAAG